MTPRNVPTLGAVMALPAATCVVGNLGAWCAWCVGHPSTLAEWQRRLAQPKHFPTAPGQEPAPQGPEIIDPEREEIPHAQ